MKLATVYARFYKSFNFDTVRKTARNAQPKGDWEQYDGEWFPYVEVPIDDRLTTIVGANESGKSHLLSAIEKAVTGQEFNLRDLCRYSPFFGVERDRTCWPHLGIAWKDLESGEATALASLLGQDVTPPDRFMMFREGPDVLTVWLPETDGTWKRFDLDSSDGATLSGQILPQPFRIHSTVALPDSVPFSWIATDASRPTLSTNRRARSTLIESVASIGGMLGADHTSVAANAAPLFSLLRPFANALTSMPSTPASDASLKLARTLLLDLAQIEPASLHELADAIADGHDGYANALTDSINAQLERHLNFRKWWVQDSDFELRVTPREHELVFTIRDRTGTEYTFEERSAGLKYFLSYLIQTQSHRPNALRERILLMDEPDTYLSAEAQQDLMRILRDMAETHPDRPAIQVVYVTHSPFLIDKNHAERIRVLEKGRGLDGTQVVSNVSQNHYEPLRSAFGAFVGETAFVGTVNLLVEGVTDQVLLAGAARIIRNRHPGMENDTLDLNRLVVVPCGSASHVPYMVYLVRGRDAEKPPVVALLDSDKAGNDAAKAFKTDKKLKGLIDAGHILQVGGVDFGKGGPEIQELEDYIPLPLAVAAANYCIEEVTQFRTAKAPTLEHVAVEAAITDGGRPMFDAVDHAARQLGGHIEKLAFARAVIEICRDTPSQNDLNASIDIFLGRMRALFKMINVARRDAERAARKERLSQMVDRQQRLFLRDHKTAARREQAADLFEDIESLLDGSKEADAIRNRLQGLRRDFKLDDEPASQIVNYEAFAEGLRGLKSALAAERLPVDLPSSPLASAPSGERDLEIKVEHHNNTED
ncbi:AAA family ATPase [Sphingomonas montana]|uniref:AAA family ATPase n=1 Tax=Sphingomonas montana TaxID=1843236 RepID=UPI0009F91D24|nr:AAA family ATPase [Sphingomonas montana]